MASLVFHTGPVDWDAIEKKRAQEIYALSKNERMKRAFQLMKLSSMFKNGPLKQPQGLGIVLSRETNTSV